MSPQGYGCHCWGHALKGKWSTTVSPEHCETEVITLTDLSKGPWLVRIKGSLKTTWNFSWQQTCPVEGWEALGKGCRSTVPPILILIFVRTQALWLRKLLCIQCDFSKRSVSHSNTYEDEWLGRGYSSENSAWKAWLHPCFRSMALFWHNTSRLRLNGSP